MIYKTFKQWKNGKFLEHFGPRKANYTQDELDLIEMGWKYGYDAGVEAEREACADIAENWRCNGMPRTGVANEIRARGAK